MKHFTQRKYSTRVINLMNVVVMELSNGKQSHIFEIICVNYSKIILKKVKHFLIVFRITIVYFRVHPDNANVVDIPTIGRAPYCYKIQGQIYYQINGALYPSENDDSKNGQLFIVDPQEAIDYRIAANVGTNREIMYSLEQMIRQYHLFAKSYVMMKEEIGQQRELLGNDTVTNYL